MRPPPIRFGQHGLSAMLLTLLSALGQSETSGFADSTVIYTATSGTEIHISSCTDETFVDPDPTRTVVDINLQPTPAADFLRDGPATFRECVRTRPVLALGDNGFTQAVIDRTAMSIDAGLQYNDSRVHEVCRHHFNRCFMFYDADPNGDGSSPVVGGTAAYNLSITYHGQVYQYPVQLRHCGQLGYHDWLRYATADHARCFLNETVMAGAAFEDVVQHAEDPHTPTIGLLGRCINHL